MEQLWSQAGQVRITIDKLTYPNIISLLKTAEDYPRLLPTVISYLGNLSLSVYVDKDEILSAATVNDRTVLIVGLNKEILESAHVSFPNTDIQEHAGVDLIRFVSSANEENEMGILLLYPENKEIKTFYITNDFFAFEKREIISLRLLEPDSLLSIETIRELNSFFSDFLEVEEVYYTSKFTKGRNVPGIIIRCTDGYDVENRFLVSTPKLIMQKEGLELEHIWVVFLEGDIGSGLPIQSIYQRKK